MSLSRLACVYIEHLRGKRNECRAEFERLAVSFSQALLCALDSKAVFQVKVAEMSVGR